MFIIRAKSDSADVDAELVTWSKNYNSASGVPDIVRELLIEDLDLANEFARGPFTWSELLKELGMPAHTPEPQHDCPHAPMIGDLAVMRLGCVDECQFDSYGRCVWYLMELLVALTSGCYCHVSRKRLDH